VPRDGGAARPSADLLAHAVLSPYHVGRKRRAVQGEHQGEGEPQPAGPRQQRPRVASPAQQERPADRQQGDAQRPLQLVDGGRNQPRGSIAGAPLDDEMPF
jgi:hypothetical protein